MDEPSPGANPLEEGWAAMGAIYREAWERALRAPGDRDAVSAALGEALERMRRLTETAEAQVFGTANVGWPVATKAEYASVGERIEGVLERVSRLEGAMSAGAVDADAPAGPDVAKKQKSKGGKKGKGKNAKTKRR